MIGGIRGVLAALVAVAAALVLAPTGAAQTGPDSFAVQSAAAGGRVTITVHNTGLRPLHWIAASLHGHANASALGGTGDARCQVEGDLGACFFTDASRRPNFLPGQARTLTLDTSSPVAQGTQLSICGGGDLNPSSQVCVPSRVETGAPDLALAFEGPAAVQVGDQAVYTFVVTNVGTAPSTPREIKVTTAGRTAPDRETQFGGNPWAPEGEKHDTTVDVPALQPGESRRFRIFTWTEALFSPLGTLILTSWGSSGERTLVADIEADGTRGANHAEHRTTMTIGPPPRNDSNANRPAGSQRAMQATAKVRSLTGTASGDVGAVMIALARVTRGTAAAPLRCSWLVSRAARFRGGEGGQGGCRRPVFVGANGTRRWRYSLSRPLPRGCYLLFSSAVSRAGRPESRFSARDRNYVRFCTP